ncbi:hypothetical protein [Aquimarina aquimarini]|uniref:hypothetical protein n=1 Tax=Aquimarina aquimarini TaxID=1191734 RepID=UPI000D55ADCC|nr:hypothetical protein [Aquimarina aquimarini]
MHLILIFVGSFLIAYFTFDFFRIYLDKKKGFRVIISFNFILALIGILLYLYSTEDKKIFYIAMLVPLYASLVYKGMVSLFIKNFGRLPEDTAFKFYVKFPDTMFNVLYGILAIVLPLALLFWLMD